MGGTMLGQGRVAVNEPLSVEDTGLNTNPFKDTPKPYVKDINRLIASRTPTGKVYFQDDFDDAPLGWDKYGTGTIAQNTTYKYMGKGCLGITTPAGAWGLQEAMKRLGMPRSLRVGLEFMTAFQTATQNFNSIRFGIEQDSSQRGFRDSAIIEIFLTGGVPVVQYVNLAGVNVPIAGFPTDYDAEVFTASVKWHHVKLIADFITREYVSIEVDNTFVSLAGIRLNNIGAPTQFNLLYPYIFACNAGAATACLTLFDELIMTEEEP